MLLRFLPWRVSEWLIVHMPRTYQLLRFGQSNVNTREHWDEAWARHGQDGFRATAELAVIRDRVQQMIPPGCKVLDVGCGAGELLDLLHREKGTDCYGADISAVAIEAVRKRGFHGEVARLPALPFDSDAFDALVCTETLEHVTDVRRSVQEFSRVLKPGGLLIISVPDGTVDQEMTHVHRFKAPQIRKMLDRDFHVSDVERHVTGEEATLLAFATRRS